MSVIDTLIYDRTQDDLDYLNALRIKYPNWTDLEKQQWFAGLKGAYNYRDLNRVGNACAYLHDLFVAAGLELTGYQTPKVNWTVEDIPTLEQAQVYIGNVQAFQRAVASPENIPSSLSRLTYEDANAIERMLAAVAEGVNNILSAFLFSGEFTSGE